MFKRCYDFREVNDPYELIHIEHLCYDDHTWIFWTWYMSKTPKVEQINVKEFTVKQSKYEVCGKLPIRSVILGPSGSGKTTETASVAFLCLARAER